MDPITLALILLWGALRAVDEVATRTAAAVREGGRKTRAAAYSGYHSKTSSWRAQPWKSRKGAAVRIVDAAIAGGVYAARGLDRASRNLPGAFQDAVADGFRKGRTAAEARRGKTLDESVPHPVRKLKEKRAARAAADPVDPTETPEPREPRWRRTRDAETDLPDRDTLLADDDPAGDPTRPVAPAWDDDDWARPTSTVDDPTRPVTPAWDDDEDGWARPATAPADPREPERPAPADESDPAEDVRPSAPVPPTGTGPIDPENGWPADFDYSRLCKQHGTGYSPDCVDCQAAAADLATDPQFAAAADAERAADPDGPEPSPTPTTPANDDTTTPDAGPSGTTTTQGDDMPATAGEISNFETGVQVYSGLTAGARDVHAAAERYAADCAAANLPAADLHEAAQLVDGAVQLVGSCSHALNNFSTRHGAVRDQIQAAGGAAEESAYYGPASSGR